jgi:hypothetical protein
VAPTPYPLLFLRAIELQIRSRGHWLVAGRRTCMLRRTLVLIVVKVAEWAKAHWFNCFDPNSWIRQASRDRLSFGGSKDAMVLLSVAHKSRVELRSSRAGVRGIPAWPKLIPPQTPSVGTGKAPLPIRQYSLCCGYGHIGCNSR